VARVVRSRKGQVKRAILFVRPGEPKALAASSAILTEEEQWLRRIGDYFMLQQTVGHKVKILLKMGRLKDAIAQLDDKDLERLAPWFKRSVHERPGVATSR